MESIAYEIISGLVLMALGAMGTGIIWIVKSILDLKKDNTAAHIKIRELEKQR